MDCETIFKIWTGCMARREALQTAVTRWDQALAEFRGEVATAGASVNVSGAAIAEGRLNASIAGAREDLQAFEQAVVLLWRAPREWEKLVRLAGRTGPGPITTGREHRRHDQDVRRRNWLLRQAARAIEPLVRQRATRGPIRAWSPTDRALALRAVTLLASYFAEFEPALPPELGDAEDVTRQVAWLFAPINSREILTAIAGGQVLIRGARLRRRGCAAGCTYVLGILGVTCVKPEWLDKIVRPYIRS